MKTIFINMFIIEKNFLKKCSLIGRRYIVWTLKVQQELISKQRRFVPIFYGPTLLMTYGAENIISSRLLG